MAAVKLLVLALTCYTASSLPQGPPKLKTTIFSDEKLKGQVFERLMKKSRTIINDRPDLHRLPTTTKAIHYNVLWSVDFNSDPQAFSGTVEIELEATQTNVTEIVIQSEDLTIGTVALVQGTTVVPVTHVLDTERDFLSIHLKTGSLQYNPLLNIVYVLTITFTAPLRDDMFGIYKSWFRNQHSDPISWMATTQFQATSARKAFPCYDEPSFKATFDITIRRPTAYSSWSNTRIKDTITSPNKVGYKDDIYYRTPIMSTYLLAIIVAEYQSHNLTNDNGAIIYEVIARPNAIATNQSQYAFDVGQKLLAKMSNHTNYDFFSMNANLKMTQASIPDFDAGAMENWGLLTYREAYVMYDPEHTNSYFKQLIASILTHEIAHMWFGNLVTCDWWDALWLNEGFASYYESFLTHWVETYMGFETRFITEQVHTALLSDSANHHPLTNPGVGSPESISAMFSTISYKKGAVIIRQTEHLLGHEVNKEGLTNYLVNFQFQTVRPINLFESLEAAGIAAGAFTEYGTSFSLVDYYKSWTEQEGHPVLEVQVNHQTGDMTIHQRRFYIHSGYFKGTTNWIIPITISSASDPDFENTKPSHILSKTITVINRGSVGDKWVLLNKQQTGYYRVNYDDYTWDLVTAALRGPAREQIHEYNRAQIVNDVFQFARSGLMSYTKALTILSFLEFETSYAPWVAAMTGFTWLRTRLTGTHFLKPFETLIVTWARTVMADLTYYPSDNEDFMRSYLRSELAPIMCQINQDTCRKEAVAQFVNLRVNQREVPVDSRNWVYCNALREGTTEDFDFLRKRFIEHNVYTEKIVLLEILGCTPHATSIHQFLRDIIETNNIVRPQDYTAALYSATAGNEENTQIVFAWIQQNLAATISAFERIGDPLLYVSSRLRTETEIDAFQLWATQNAAALGDYVFDDAEASRRGILWTATVTADISRFLERGAMDKPDSPDFAVASFLSVSVVVFAFIFNFLL